MKRRDFMKSVAGSALALALPMPRIVASDGKKPMITGYAAKFAFTDVGSPPNCFRERIEAGAFDKALAGEHDIHCVVNFCPGMKLGSTKDGTLRLSVDSTGLRYELDLPDTNLGRYVREEKSCGNINEGISFEAAEDDWQWPKDGAVKRTIASFKRIYDVSLNVKQ